MPASPGNELPEPLKSVVDGIARRPPPGELIEAAKNEFSQPIPERASSPRKGLAIVASVLALSLCVVAILQHENQPPPAPKIAHDSGHSSNPEANDSPLPPPTFWSYRQALETPEGFDELLNRHAAVLLKTAVGDEALAYQPLSRKEEL